MFHLLSMKYFLLGDFCSGFQKLQVLVLRRWWHWRSCWSWWHWRWRQARWRWNRFGRRRHHGRGRGPSNGAATPGIGQLEAELQEELLGLLVPVRPEPLLRLVYLT